MTTIPIAAAQAAQGGHSHIASIVLVIAAIAAAWHAISGNHRKSWGIVAVAAVAAMILANPGHAGSTLASLAGSALKLAQDAVS